MKKREISIFLGLAALTSLVMEVLILSEMSGVFSQGVVTMGGNLKESITFETGNFVSIELMRMVLFGVYFSTFAFSFNYYLSGKIYKKLVNSNLFGSLVILIFFGYSFIVGSLMLNLFTVAHMLFFAIYFVGMLYIKRNVYLSK